MLHFINGLHCFYRITVPLKCPLVPKSDVKQKVPTNIGGTSNTAGIFILIILCCSAGTATCHQTHCIYVPGAPS